MSPNFNLKISRQAALLVLVPLMVEFVFLVLLAAALQQAENELIEQNRSKAIISEANAMSKLFYDAGVAMGGYSITKSPLFATRFETIRQQLPLDADELEKLIGKDTEKQAVLKRIRSITSDGIRVLQEAKTASDDNKVDVAQFRSRAMYKRVRAQADQLQEALKTLTKDAHKVQEYKPGPLSGNGILVKILLLVSFLFNVGVAFLVFGSIGNSTESKSS